MSDEQIMALPMASLAAEDAYLLLWSTAAHLPLAFDCLALWGFDYKAIHTWVKTSSTTGNPQIGLGHYGRNCTEFFLVATKGSPKAWSTLGLTNIPTVLYESKKEHSKKPSQFWDTANALKAKLGGPTIELFAREPRNHWERWGLESD